MDSFSNIENLMTPTKQNFDPNAPMIDENMELPDTKKNFVAGQSLKFSPNRDAKKSNGLKEILG